MALRLIVETPTVDLDEYEYIVEQRDPNSPKTLYIKGPFLGADVVNRNKRRYPLDEMIREVDRFNKEMIAENRAMGELNHPTSADINLERACHLITELKQDGNVFIGKSKVLTTPCGHIVRALINDGVKIGVSSRALGQLVEESLGVNRVQNLRLITVDCVADPSFSKSFVNGILESKQWVLNEDGSLEEHYDRFESALSKLPRHDVENYIKQNIMNFLQNIK